MSSKPYSGGVKLASGIAPNGDFYVADSQDIKYDNQSSVKEKLDELYALIMQLGPNNGGSSGGGTVINPTANTLGSFMLGQSVLS